MKSYLFILKTFKLMRYHQPGKLLFIFLLTLFMGVNSGFSIMLLIPLLQLLDVGSAVTAGGPALFFRDLASKTGIPLTIETLLIIYVALLTLNALLQYWKAILDTRYQQSLIYQLRRRLFRKIILADWPLLNSKSKTNHMQVLTKEVPNMAVYVYYYMHLLTTFIIAISYLGYALAVSPGFTLIIIFVGAVLFIFLRRFLFRSFHLGDSFVSSYNRLLKYIDDFWQTVKIAKVHSSEDFYYSKFDEASTSLLDLEFRMQKNWSLPQLIYRISGIMVLVLIVYIGYHTGKVPITSFFILILLFSRIFPQFVGMNTDVNMIISNVPSVKMVMQLDEDFPDNDFNKKTAGESTELLREIRLENIQFAYVDGKTLFEKFSETIPAKSITGIIGESGIGKTTLIDLIAGLQKPDEGKVFIDDTELDDNMLSGWKEGIGYLPQDSFFIDGTIRENLVWDSNSDITDAEIWDALVQVNATHLVQRFENGLDKYIVNYPFCFSGGECQRLALARVLLRRPRLLLLDEATSSLDTENEALIMDVIKQLKEKMTIVFVTHRSTLLPCFDKVIKL
jgi:ATP-binding cassette, subfamily C, bacterial